MSFLIKKIPRRTFVQALVALPTLSLFRARTNAGRPTADLPGADPDEIVEVNGWILKRSDLA